MYCKKCGCKLDSGTTRCPDCGADSSDIEYCGGFWNLVGQPDQAVIEHPPIDNGNAGNSDRSEVQTENSDNRKSNVLIGLGFTFAVINLVICIVLVFYLFNTNKKYEALNEKYNALTSVTAISESEQSQNEVTTETSTSAESTTEAATKTSTSAESTTETTTETSTEEATSSTDADLSDISSSETSDENQKD